MQSNTRLNKTADSNLYGARHDSSGFLAQKEPTYMDPAVINRFLHQVTKPGRYSGGEYGIAQRNPDQARARLVTLFPDIYEIGMSNQGWKILYDRVNRKEELFADRAFLPWSDAIDRLREYDLELFTLDHRLAVRSFDVIGINLSHELQYTNLLLALELSGIPLRRTERTAEHPLVIAGGTAITNPLPVASFVDGFFLGDGEEAIIELMEIVAEGNDQARKGEKVDRVELIDRLHDVDGFLSSARIAAMRRGDRGFSPVSPRAFRAPVYGDLKNIPVPSIQITQDRVVVETSRGCGQGCRFCHAGFWKRPVRMSDPDALVEEAKRMLSFSGNDSISLHSLSLADYPHLEYVVERLSAELGPEGISLSLPSLRVDERTIPILEATAGIRKSSVTFALEAGSEYMRAVIHKQATEERLLSLVREIFERGWDLVKVYYMVGLPDKNNTEVEDVIQSLNRLGEVARQMGGRKNINVSISLFVPRPHTTFQWERLQSPEFFTDALDRIRKGLKTRRVHLKSPNPWMSYVEGILARVDEHGAELIEEAYRRGATFDSWDDRFQKEIWQQVLSMVSPDTLASWIHPANRLPWEGIVAGVSDRFLKVDYKRFEQITPENTPRREHKPAPARFSPRPVQIPDERLRSVGKLRLVIERTGPGIFLGHLDFAEVVRRALRRVGVPATFTGGFNKHEKIRFSDPLPLFFHSRGEVAVVDLYQKIDPDPLLSQINDRLPPGFRVMQIDFLEEGSGIPAGPGLYTIDWLDENRKEQHVQLIEDMPDTLSFTKEQKRSRGKRKKGKSKSKSMEVKEYEKLLKSAVQVLRADEHSMLLQIDGDAGKGVSSSDFFYRYLGIEYSEMDEKLRITREMAQDRIGADVKTLQK